MNQRLNTLVASLAVFGMIALLFALPVHAKELVVGTAQRATIVGCTSFKAAQAIVEAEKAGGMQAAMELVNLSPECGSVSGRFVIVSALKEVKINDERTVSIVAVMLGGIPLYTFTAMRVVEGVAA